MLNDADGDVQEGQKFLLVDIVQNDLLGLADPRIEVLLRHEVLLQDEGIVYEQEWGIESGQGLGGLKKQKIPIHDFRPIQRHAKRLLDRKAHLSQRTCEPLVEQTAGVRHLERLGAQVRYSGRIAKSSKNVNFAQVEVGDVDAREFDFNIVGRAETFVEMREIAQGDHHGVHKEAHIVVGFELDFVNDAKESISSQDALEELLRLIRLGGT